MTREPVAIPAAILAMISLIIGWLAPQFGWDQQIAADIEVAAVTVVGAIIAVGVLVQAWYSRRKVTPVADPHLPLGTEVNLTDAVEGDGVIVPKGAGDGPRPAS